MSDLAVGKNGMPVHIAPVRIYRPGDAGFPADAGQHDQPTRTEPMSDKTLCMFHGCSNPKPPGMGRRYCAEHADPAVRQKAKARPNGKAAKAVEKPEAGKAVAAAIGNLRQKAAAPAKSACTSSSPPAARRWWPTSRP